jgi:hypothetical protein
MDKLLDELRVRGISSIGVLEETLPEASLNGELYCASGSGIMRFKELNPVLADLVNRDLVKPTHTYVLCFNPEVRRRIQTQLHYILPPKAFRNLGEKVLELNESEIRLREVNVGISEAVKKYLNKKGFSVIPRLSNDPRYDIPGKISELLGYQVIIFDGEEILGYPDKVIFTGLALKKSRLKYGCIEIIKQDGDQELKSFMGKNLVRVHSVPKDELLKITKDEAVVRFVRAVKERGIRLIYVRPFLPPQVSEDPVKYNLQYLLEVKDQIERSGYELGKASSIGEFSPKGWQVLVLGIGVIIVTLLLLDAFIPIPWYLMWLFLLISPFIIILVGAGGRNYYLEKGLALLAAIMVPAYAVISQYRNKVESQNPLIGSVYLVFNVVAESLIGVFLIIGLLANTDFMLGAQTFAGVKMALIVPILITGFYFLPRTKDKILDLLNQRIPAYFIVLFFVLLGALGVFLARSGNFTLPVPQVEKIARNILELVLAVRPRTKEFLIGYPALILAGILFIRDRKDWLWLWMAVGVIAPISLLNSFTHVHTPILVSGLRSIIGLVLGVMVGGVVGAVYLKFGRK